MILIHKGFQIKPHAITPTSYVVVTDGKGGKIPNILEGVFTSPSVAVGIIDTYISGKEAKKG